MYYIKQKPLEQASTRIRNVSSDNLCAFLMRFVIFTVSKRNERTVLDIYIYINDHDRFIRPIYDRLTIALRTIEYERNRSGRN